MKKTHFIDNRLLVNAGMRFPACRANEKLLNLEAAWLPMSNDINEVTCKHCKTQYFKKERS